jgi:cell division septation protein DedD
MAERGPRHRFELTRLEMGGVIVSAAATLFVVFLLGVYAGRGMDGGNAGAQQLVRLPVAAATEDDGAEDKWTFDETLPEGKVVGSQHAAVAAPPHPGAAAARDAGTGGQAASGAPPAREETRERADAAPHAAPAARDDAADAADAEASGGVAAARAKEPAPKEPVVAEKKVARPAAAEPTPRARIAVAMVSVGATPQAGARGEWSVQVTATKDPRTADAMAQRLKARGYQAYVQRVQRGEGTLYRVRVGKYPSLESANQIVSRLRREPGVPEAFVASD